MQLHQKFGSLHERRTESAMSAQDQETEFSTGQKATGNVKSSFLKKKKKLHLNCPE